MKTKVLRPIDSNDASVTLGEQRENWSRIINTAVINYDQLKI